MTADGNLDETVWYLLQKEQEDGSLETVGEDKNEAGTEFTFTLPKNTGKQDITYILTVKDREPAADGSSGYDWTGAATASIIARAEQGEVETPEGPQKPETPEEPGTPETPEDPETPETPEDPEDPKDLETPENSEKSENSQKPVIKVGGIKLSAPSGKIAAGKSVKVTASVSPANANNRKVKWKSSNTKYASVNQSGKVTMKKAGAGKSVTITATAVDGSGRKASYRFHIMKGSVRKIVLQSEKSVKVGKKIKITAKVKTTGKKANKKLKWTSSNTKYASVSQKGVVKAKKAGRGKKVKITASSTDGSNKKKVIKIKIK